MNAAISWELLGNEQARGVRALCCQKVIKDEGSHKTVSSVSIDDLCT
jgi:hypothetical protein